VDIAEYPRQSQVSQEGQKVSDHHPAAPLFDAFRTMGPVVAQYGNDDDDSELLSYRDDLFDDKYTKGYLPFDLIEPSLTAGSPSLEGKSHTGERIGK